MIIQLPGSSGGRLARASWFVLTHSNFPLHRSSHSVVTYSTSLDAVFHFFTSMTSLDSGWLPNLYFVTSIAQIRLAVWFYFLRKFQFPFLLLNPILWLFLKKIIFSQKQKSKMFSYRQFSTFFSDFNIKNFQLDNASSISLYQDCTLLKYIFKIKKSTRNIFRSACILWTVKINYWSPHISIVSPLFLWLNLFLSNWIKT